MLSLVYYLILAVLCTLFLIVSALVLLVAWPFDPARRAVHELSRVLVRIFFFIPPLWRTRVTGLEHIDRRKSYVIVINHRAMTDIPALYHLPLNFRWVSKREVFRIPFFGQFLMVHGDICIDRGRAAEAMEQLLRDGRKWIDRGASVAIFPEGTRSKDGAIHRFKAGAFTLAHEAGVEVLPVVMHGTNTMVRKNRLFNWRNTLTINVLEPRSAAGDPKELAVEVHDAMAATLEKIQNSKFNIQN